MQEIVLILSSLAGVATAAAVRKMPRDKKLLSLSASPHIKSQVSSLKIEKDILTKTISRLYQAESEFSKIQKDKLLLKYQHQLGIVLAKLEKLEQASKHPDLGPVGDGLITLMDQKLAKLDERLYEISSKITSAKIEPPKKETRAEKTEPKHKPYNFEVPKHKPGLEIPTKQNQSFELTTLTNFTNESKIPEIKKPQPVVRSEIILPNNDIRKTGQDKIGDTQLVTRPDINKEFAKITQYKALPEPKTDEKSKTILDEDFDDDADDLDKIKRNIMNVLSKLDQAEVE